MRFPISLIENYWFQSGTPEFLVRMLERSEEPFTGIFNDEADSISLSQVDRMKALLEAGDVDEFMRRLQSFLASISYRLTSKAPEIYFENNLFVIFSLMGFEVNAEEETSEGRIDLTVKTPKHIYVLEIKVDRSAGEALDQIGRKEYALKYRNDDRKIILIGINFSSSTRNITEWVIKEDQ